MRFELNAEFTVDEQYEDSEKNIYNIEYGVKLLKSNNEKAVIYDKELRMYFENTSGIRYIYEVETKEVKLSLARRIKKSGDFMRRLFYRYDWIQFCVNRRGQIYDIDNRKELGGTWSRLKKRIFKDYKGVMAERYIKRLDDDYAAGYEPERSINQYLHFGLLFPNIPFEHHNEWSNKRSIRCSEYETERFEENIIYQKTEDNMRYYSISGKIQPESNVNLIRYEGTVCVPEEDIFPVKTELKIEYTQGIRKINWDFELERQG